MENASNKTDEEDKSTIAHRESVRNNDTSSPEEANHQKIKKEVLLVVDDVDQHRSNPDTNNNVKDDDDDDDAKSVATTVGTRTSVGGGRNDGGKKDQGCCTQCLGFVRSISFLLPATVALIVVAMASSTITLMTLNTNKAVETVVESLQDQIQTQVESSIFSHLDQVLTINRASAKALKRQNLGLPVSNSSRVLPQFQGVADMLSRVVADYPVIDVHYIFFRNGRVVANLPLSNTSSMWAEEYYPNGLQFWVYETYNSSSIVQAYNTPSILNLTDYVGYQRSYFRNVRHDVDGDWAWTNPYIVGPFLLFTNTISVVADDGTFLGVMGSDSYLSTLAAFLKNLQTTDQTKILVVDPNDEIVMATHGEILTVNGTRIASKDSADPTFRAATAAIGSWNSVTSGRRLSFKEGKTWLLSVRRFDRLRAQLIIAVMTPEEEFLAPVRDATRDTIIICSCIAVVGLAIIIALCVLISRNLHKLQSNLRAVSRLEVDESSNDDDLDDDDNDESDIENEKEGNDKKKRKKKADGEDSEESGEGIFTELKETNRSYLRLRKAIRAFRHYVPENVVHGVLGGSIRAKPGMTQSELVVSFQDIANFTGICEKLPTPTVVRIVSTTFETMSEVIMSLGGIIDKYIGDCIMAFWVVSITNNNKEGGGGGSTATSPRHRKQKQNNNEDEVQVMDNSTLTASLNPLASTFPVEAAAPPPPRKIVVQRFTWERGAPLSYPQACINAITAMHRSFETFRSEEGMIIKLRSGLHCGTAMLGNFGSTTRFNYTIVGDTVNIAARLEPLNKEMKSSILISDDVIRHAKEIENFHSQHADLLMHTRPVGKVMLVGKALPLTVHDLAEHAYTEEELSLWNSAVEHFNKDEFVEARNSILAFLDARGGGGGSIRPSSPSASSLVVDPVAEEFLEILRDLREPSNGIRQQRSK